MEGGKTTGNLLLQYTLIDTLRSKVTLRWRQEYGRKEDNWKSTNNIMEGKRI